MSLLICCYAEYCYTERRFLFLVMLSVESPLKHVYLAREVVNMVSVVDGQT